MIRFTTNRGPRPRPWWEDHIPRKPRPPSEVYDPHQSQPWHVLDQESLTTLRRSNNCPKIRSLSMDSAGERVSLAVSSLHADPDPYRRLSCPPPWLYSRSSRVFSLDLRFIPLCLTYRQFPPVLFSYRRDSGPSVKVGESEHGELFVDVKRRRCSGFLVFGVTIGDGGAGVGAGVGEYLGSTDVPVTFKMGSGSQVYGLKLDGDRGSGGEIDESRIRSRARLRIRVAQVQRRTRIHRPCQVLNRT